MNYYYVFLNTAGDFDDETIYTRLPNQPLGTENVGLIFDWWALDDLFQSSPEVFSTERLKFLMESDSQKFTGIEMFEPVIRISVGSNWIEKYPTARPGNYWKVKINGRSQVDDFGYYVTDRRWLVVSERAVKFLLHNHVTEILGERIDIDIKSFFNNYEKRNKQTNYPNLPRKLFNLDAFFNN